MAETRWAMIGWYGVWRRSGWWIVNRIVRFKDCKGHSPPTTLPQTSIDHRPSIIELLLYFLQQQYVPAKFFLLFIYLYRFDHVKLCELGNIGV